MRLSLAWFGWELDFSLEPAPTYEPVADEFLPYQDAGTTTSYPVGFTRAEIPWDADGPVHQFDPDETGEDA